MSKYCHFPGLVFTGFQKLDEQDAGLLAVDEGGLGGVGGHCRLDVVGKIPAWLQAGLGLIPNRIHNLS